jgi:2'-5' RNA ligase
LEFLGGVSEQQRQCAEAVAGQIQGTPFELTLDQLGMFPRAGVVWLGTNTTPEILTQLVEDLRAGLAGCGLTLDPRPYTPHLTLMRKASRKIELPEQIQPVCWRVEQFVLVESVTHPGGAVYQVLRSWDLK